jgi:hypothetical protein
MWTESIDEVVESARESVRQADVLMPDEPTFQEMALMSIACSLLAIMDVLTKQNVQ